MLVLVIQLQSFYVSAMMVTILLHLRTFRKVLLLDVRRVFISVTESGVFRWMKRGNNGTLGFGLMLAITALPPPRHVFLGSTYARLPPAVRKALFLGVHVHRMLDW